MNNLKLKSSYDQFAGDYHDYMDDKHNFWNKWLEYPHTIKFLSNQGLKNKIVLDLGCGSARYTKELVKLGAKVRGIDISEKLIQIAKKELPEVDMEGSSWISFGVKCSNG